MSDILTNINSKMLFINTQIAPKIEKRLDIFNKFRNNNYDLLILNSNNETNDFNKFGYRILECISIFQEQLPFMPKSYIISQALDPSNYILALINEGKIATCLLFRPFLKDNLVEIVFLASSSIIQSNGFGYLCLAIFKELFKRSLNGIKVGIMTKEFIDNLHEKSTNESIESFIYTYADFQACSFFRKHQFSRSITNSSYKGLIKDYEGGYLMECILSEKFNYLTLTKDLFIKKNKSYEKFINENSIKSINNQFLLDFNTTKDILIKMDIPIKKYNQIEQIKNIMKFIITTIQSEPSSWPFLEPVNSIEVPEYLTIIKEPMDLLTMSHKIKDNIYKNLNEFRDDFDLIIKNCYTFNGNGNIYSKKASELDRKFKSILKKVILNLKNPLL